MFNSCVSTWIRLGLEVWPKSSRKFVCWHTQYTYVAIVQKKRREGENLRCVLKVLKCQIIGLQLILLIRTEE